MDWKGKMATVCSMAKEMQLNKFIKARLLIFGFILALAAPPDARQRGYVGIQVKGEIPVNGRLACVDSLSARDKGN
jgi:hypothetical protein